MQKLHPKELSTFHFLVSCLGYTIVEVIMYDLFTIVLLNRIFPKFFQETQMEIICESYTDKKLRYQLTSLRFTKLLAFHLLSSCLGYIIYEGVVEDIFTIVLLGESFQMVS
jgi:hypothetical protein